MPLHCRSPLIITLLLLAATAQHPSDGLAALKGDKKNLSRVIAKYRENLERLETWKGKARYSNGAVAEFAYDAKSGKYRYNITTVWSVTKAGEAIAQRTPMSLAGLFDKEDFYHLSYVTSSDGYRMARVDGKKKMTPGWHSGTFEAMFFFTENGRFQDGHLKVLVANFDDPRAIGSVTRDGDIVTVRRVIGDDSVEKVFSLAKGGNATRITTVERRPDGSERVWETTWEWENVNDVWVPISARHQEPDSADGDKGDLSIVEWEQNLVNVPLDEREFSPARLGLRQGDFIVDSRTGTKKRAKGPEFPPRKSQLKDWSQW